MSDLDICDEVAVYVKQPDGFFILTPIGMNNSNWANGLYEDNVKQINFVAETKGFMQTLIFKDHTSASEQAKIHCARLRFKTISNGDVVYDEVSNHQELLNLVTK